MPNTLRSRYIAKKMATLQEHAARADQRLREELVLELAAEKAAAHFSRASILIESINEGRFDPQQAKEIAKQVKRLEALVDKLGGENGQMPNISKMLNSVIQELNEFDGSNWWTRLLGAMKDSRNPITKAVALEALLKGGMEYVGTLLDQQGKKLTDDPINEQGQVGKNIINAMSRAFDPGRISSLSSLGGGKISQFFGTSKSLGSIIANDLSNLKPSQLRAFADEIKSLGKTVPPQEVTPNAVANAASETPQATNTSQSVLRAQTQDQSEPTASVQSQAANAPEEPSQPQPQTQVQAPQASTNTKPDSAPQQKPVQTIDPDEIANKAGLDLANMFGSLKKNNQPGALFYAAKALQKLGLDVDSALRVLSPKKATPQAQPQQQPTSN